MSETQKVSREEMAERLRRLEQHVREVQSRPPGLRRFLLDNFEHWVLDPISARIGLKLLRGLTTFIRQATEAGCEDAGPEGEDAELQPEQPEKRTEGTERLIRRLEKAKNAYKSGLDVANDSLRDLKREHDHLLGQLRDVTHERDQLSVGCTELRQEATSLRQQNEEALQQIKTLTEQLNQERPMPSARDLRPGHGQPRTPTRPKDHGDDSPAT